MPARWLTNSAPPVPPRCHHHVRDQLATDVQHVYSAGAAVAAVRSDGSAITWGDARYGGNRVAVQGHHTTDAQQVYSTN